MKSGGLVVLGIWGLWLISVGCQKAADNRPARAATTVTVTYRGAPVEGATVTLHPLSPDGKAAFGRTDAQGRATLGTFDSGDGAIPGEYLVTVVKPESGQESAPNNAGDIGAMPANPTTGAAPSLSGASGPRHLLPAKYADTKTSGLKVTVNAEGKNDLTVTLED